MFYLMARRAKTPTHFYPLSLSTYDILPPPETIQKELGEMRRAKRCPLQIAFADEFDMEKFPGSEENEKSVRRKAKADAIWNIVNANYKRIK
jgi:glycerol-3-phosphate O-acyltransferase